MTLPIFRLKKNHWRERADLQTFEPVEKWKYAYPGVFEGSLSTCTWEAASSCLAPLTGSSCFEVSCKDLNVTCPPSGQEVCPEFKNMSCGNMPGTSKPYWAHKCSPFALPRPGLVTVLQCVTDPLEDGSFQCYFRQVNISHQTANAPVFKIKQFFWGYFDPENIFIDNGNK